MSRTPPDGGSDGGPGPAAGAGILPAGALRRFAAGRTAGTQRVPRRTPGEPVPLTPVQQRLWFLDRAGLGGDTYLTWWVGRLTGPLDSDALARALFQVVTGHEALRAGVVERDGRAYQVATEPDHLDPAGLLERVDLTGLPPAQRDQAARSWIDGFLSRGFDLSRPPLLRAALVRIDATGHVLAVSAHHIVCDGTASGVIIEELWSRYRVLATSDPAPAGPAPESPAPVDPAPVGFLDYASWLAGRGPVESAADREYWRSHLAGAPAATRLPADRPRPARPTRRGARHTLALTPELSTAVRALAHRERRTLFSILTGALAAVLVRFGAEEDLVLGAPASTRDRPELERTVGMFANTVALRTDLRGNPTLREVLDRAAETVTSGLEHAGFPFEQVVELVGAHRDLRQNPVFQVMLVVGPGGEPERTVAPGLRQDGWPLPALPARFDLTVAVFDGETWELHLDYAAELFDAATIVRIADGLRRMLHAMATRPEQRLWAVPVAARAGLSLAAGPDPDDPPDPPAVTSRAGLVPVPVLIAHRVAATPDAPAVVTEAGTVSYRELWERAAALAGDLRSAGAGPGTLVGVVLPTSIEAVVAILAALRTGSAYLPLDPSHPAERTEAILSEAAVPVVVTGAGVVRRAAVPPAVPGAVAADARPVRLADPAYAIYTSGSTGRPKGVLVTHRTLAQLTGAFVTAHDLGPQTRLLMLPPLTFDASVGDLFPVLASGGALVLHPEPARLDGPELVRFCAAHGVTAVDTAAPLWRRWTADLATDPPPEDWPVATMMVGGEPVPMAAVRAWDVVTGGRTVLFNHYGPTEATVCVTVHRVRRPGGNDGVTHLPIGRPLPHVRAYVRDPYGGLAPVGVTGELYLGGDCLALGYLDRPGLTAQRFLPDPDAAEPGARMYRTGDLARLRADGQWEFLGRVDRQVKIHGHRIEPAEIEAALTAHPKVGDAAVVARVDPGPAKLVAYVAGRDLRPEELRPFLRQRLPDYLVPAAFVVLDRLPRTAHGKVDQSALPAPATTGSSAPPRGPLETELARVWAEVLEVSPVGRHDNFFDLGGHSLLAAGLFAEVRRRFGVTLPLSTLFETADLAELAAAVAAARAGGPVESSDALDLAAEAELPDDIRAAPASPGPGPAWVRPRHVLVTGATGFLGAHLVAQLLARSPATVHCLARAADPAQAKARVLESLRGQGLPVEPERIVGVPGDLTAPGFGLSEVAFAALAARVDVICHNGGLVNFIEPYHRLRLANVAGTLTVLRLAAAGSGPGRGATPVHFVSTLGLFLTDRYRPGPVSEGDHPDDPAGLVDGYNQSKWVADALVRRAGQRGIPVVVHRPARVGTHSRTGRGNPDDYFARLLATCAQVGMVPALPYDEDIAPVDYVAAGIAHLATSAPASTAHHYFNPQMISYAEIATALSAHGHPVRLVDWSRWRHAVGEQLAAGVELALAPFLVSLPERTPRFDRPGFDCHGTETALASAGIACPPADRALLGRQLDQLAALGRLRVPAGSPGQAR